METIKIVDGIIVKDNKILLLKKFQKDYYEFPGGKVEKGESLSACLKRELAEEIGVVPTKFKELETINLEFENKKITDHGFIIEKYAGEPKILETEIFQEMKWIKTEEINTVKTAPNVKPLLRKLS